MQQIDWMNILQKQISTVDILLQEGYIQQEEACYIGSSKIRTYRKICTPRVIMKITIKNKDYRKIRYFNAIILKNENVIEKKLKWWVHNFKKYMSKTLHKKDFTWVTVDDKNHRGYFSFKEPTSGFEICLDKDIKPKWTVFLCNNFEEVLEEKEVETEEAALDKANDFFRGFAKLSM